MSDSDRRYQVHFLSPNATVSSLTGNTSTNRRSLEASRSEARSHAARVSHPSAKARKAAARSARVPNAPRSGESSASQSVSSDTVSQSPSPDSAVATPDASAGNVDTRAPKTTLPILNFRLLVGNAKDKQPRSSSRSQQEVHEDLEDEIRRQRALSVTANPPKEISKSALDPFARAALDLSVPDEHLLHIYLSTVPDQIYGSSAPHVSEVIRNGTVGVVATNDIVVMQLLLVIEAQIVSFQPTRKDRQLSILTRRSAIYTLLTERLASQETVPSDDYLLAVSGMAATEHRMGNSQGARFHIAATRQLLELRGGLRSIRDVTYPVGLMVVNILVEQGVDGLWKNLVDVRERVASFSRWIRDAQTWNFTFRYQNTMDEQTFRDYPTPDSDDGSDQTWLPSGGHSNRARAFGPASALSDYVTLPQGELDDGPCRFYLSILFALNRALHAFRDSESTTDAYLAGLKTAVEMSALHNFTLRAGGAKLPSLLLLLMIAHSAVESEHRNKATDVVFHVEEVFEMVQMMMMASLATRMHVLRAFESWLKSPITAPNDLDFVSNAQLEILAGEVEDAWLLSNQARGIAV